MVRGSAQSANTKKDAVKESRRVSENTGMDTLNLLYSWMQELRIKNRVPIEVVMHPEMLDDIETGLPQGPVGYFSEIFRGSPRMDYDKESARVWGVPVLVNEEQDRNFPQIHTRPIFNLPAGKVVHTMSDELRLQFMKVAEERLHQELKDLSERRWPLM